ncbi:methylosome subunit pICln [Galendromus occidentalis]|uniref:Methylosome subunit pICln n=1 Tax=Galendromus occidentalis TaxID=34638 RepID=A0AAJ6VVF6_9ACAR|nr:methylosome subunit pICln [Galendromus occidentalis]
MVDFSSLEVPTEGIRHRQANTQAFISSRDCGKGTLYICESRVSWRSDAGTGFSLEYPRIQIHAVTRDPILTSAPCLYVVIDEELLDIYMGNQNGDGNLDEHEEGQERDSSFAIRFVPESDTVLDSMYKAMSDCQALHPDPCSDSEPEAEDEDEYDVDEAEQGNGVDENGDGDADQPMDGQFDDAD